MHPSIRAAYSQAIADSATRAELAELVATLPAEHDLADEIDAREASFPQVPLAEATAAEIADKIRSDETLRDALAPLFAADAGDGVELSGGEHFSITDEGEATLTVSAGEIIVRSLTIVDEDGNTIATVDENTFKPEDETPDEANAVSDEAEVDEEETPGEEEILAAQDEETQEESLNPADENDLDETLLEAEDADLAPQDGLNPEDLDPADTGLPALPATHITRRELLRAYYA